MSGYVATVDCVLYGREYGTNSTVDVSGWTRKQLLQQLQLGFITLNQAGAPSAGAIAAGISVVGTNVTTEVDADGRLIVTIRGPHVGDTEPPGPNLVDDLWLDVGTHTVRAWDGTAWVDWSTL